VRVHGELARRVRVHAREQDHAPAADPAGHVLDRRRRRPAALELLAHQPLVLLGLAQVLGEDPAQLGVAGHARGEPELGQRLLLDRVDVGQVLGQLLVERVVGHDRVLPGRPPRHVSGNR
jgi:hypothetical protein